MISFRKSFAFLSLLLVLNGAWAADNPAPEFLVTSWRNEEGLPHSTINSLLQTHDGYLWIGTYVGLVRFDGKRFVQYSSGNVPDLEAGLVMHLFEDRDHTLWVSLKSGRLLAWKENSVRVILSGGSAQSPVIAMAQQADGTIWFQTENGALGRIQNNLAEFLPNVPRSNGRRYLGLVVDADDQLWVGTSRGLRILRQGKLESPEIKSLNDQPVEAMARARDGAVWILFKRNLWKVRRGETLSRLEVPEKFTDEAGMLEALDGRFWLGSGDGGLFYHEPNGDWREVPRVGFHGMNRLLYEDHEGNLWRGGFGGGLTRIRPRLVIVHELPDTSLDRYARTVCSDSKGNLWAVLNGNVLARLAAGEETPQPWMNSNIRHPIKTLFMDHRDTLWVGTDGGHLYRFRDGKFVPELNLGGVESISALFEDSEQNLWVGYTGGAGVGFLPNGDVARWQTLEGMPFPDVRAITQATDGSMWFGTHYGGAIRWKDGQWTRLTVRDGMPSDYVRCLFPDADGSVWFGTLHGLCRWRDGKLVTINREQGLWNDSISHIADDGQGNFWISSFGGIFRVRREELNDFAEGRIKTVQCVGFDRNDGLTSVECSGGFQPAGAKTPDGRLWFPTVGGLVSVAPNEIAKNRLPPPVWIESIAIDGQPLTVTHTPETVQVPPGKRRFDFRFTALSFSSPEKVLFRHRLAGLDSEWSAPEAQRTVTYNYLPPGHYTFEVSACNNDGVWNTEGTSLALNVQPFVWQTWWFKTAAGLLLAAALAWGVRRRERWKARLRLERIERQHAVERERSRIAKDIHDDLGANLTQIVFLSQRVEGTTEDPAEVQRWIQKIPATASRTIQSLDEIVWAINPKHDTLESLANYLSRFAQEFLSLAGIRCVLDVPTVLPAVPLSAEVRHNLVLTAREAFQNAATHAAATEVRVKLQWSDDELQIAISDNGSGFDPALTGTHGNGLANMRRRLTDVGGTLEILSKPGAGTTVQIKLAGARLHGRVVGRGIESI